MRRQALSPAIPHIRDGDVWTGTKRLNLPVAMGHLQLSIDCHGRQSHVSCPFQPRAWDLSPPKDLGEPPSKGLAMKAQLLKDITSGRQEDHSTGQPGKVVGVRTQTYGISPVQRGEGHDQHFVLERDLGREFLICASTAWVKLDIQ